MSYYSDRDSSRVMISRIELKETLDDGDFQRITAEGHDDEILKKIGRNMPFGLASHAPVGSIGHAISISGRRDMAWALGLEHPEHRPKNLAAGTTRIYNAHGDVVSLVERNIRIVSARVDINP